MQGERQLYVEAYQFGWTFSKKWVILKAIALGDDRQRVVPRHDFVKYVDCIFVWSIPLI